nr:ribonuclease H-like domain-containing protein [Tanacetum cinerariifolium]
MHKAFPLPVTEFPLPEELPTAREDSCHYQKKREATARKIALLSMSRRNCQSKVAVTLSYQEDEEESSQAAVWNFRAKGSETLEQTFSRLQVIVGQLQFIDVEVKQDDLNQKFLTSLAPEWLMHTIVWRNRSDLDTMSLDDLYNHLKKLDTLKKEMEGVDGKLAGLLTASKDLDNLIGSQRADKNKEGLGHSVVPPPPPPPAQLYSSPKKDLSWTGLPECKDDTVTDYSSPEPIVESVSLEKSNMNVISLRKLTSCQSIFVLSL